MYTISLAVVRINWFFPYLPGTWNVNRHSGLDEFHSFLFHVLVDDTFCKGKPNGYYQDPKDCAAFYQCTGGSAFRKQCLRGQIFNEILKACDNPVNFPCQQRSVIDVFIPIKEKATNQAAKLKTQHDLPETSSSTLAKGMLHLSCTHFSLQNRSKSCIFQQA